MKVLIPAAGMGTRLLPHTHHRPKPLIPVAGKTVLGHVLDKLGAVEIDELIFIVGHLGDQIQRYVDENYDYRTRYVRQAELKGQAHAIALARDYIDGPLLILFVDTIFEADLVRLPGIASDGVIYYKEVSDPRRFGIITVGSDGLIRDFVEKPERSESNRAVIGLYYLKSGEALVGAIDTLIARDMQT
jgi:glucose-1-phosphate thymidylyltransferase